MKWLIPLAIWIIALAVIHTGIRPYEGGDGRLEMWRAMNTIEYGWIPTDKDYNNTSVALNIVAPSVSVASKLSIKNVFRDVFPLMYALTPVGLYFLFRRVMSQGKAALSALFFIVLPPSYQEIPNIAKSMIAEPLAVGSLLVMTSGIRSWGKGTLGVLLSWLALMAHYTVGIFGLMWLGIAAIMNRQKVWLAVAIIGVVFAIGYFSYVGSGAVINGIVGWDVLGGNTNDNVAHALDGKPFVTYNGATDKLPEYKDILWYYPLSLPFAVPSWVMSLVTRLAIAVLFSGGIWWATHREYMVKHKELSAMIAFSAVLVICAMYTPFLTSGLYLSRWVQLAAIPMSGLYGMGTHWAKPKYSYTVAGIILLLLLVVR